MSFEEYEREIYSTLETNFDKYYYDFDYPKVFENNIWDYYRVLKRYLINNGYGYASKLVEKYIRNKEYDDKELARVLMDCNLIKKYKKLFISDIDNKSKFEYDNEKGLNEKFYIKYADNVTLDIKDPVYYKGDYIHHSIDYEDKTIYFEINIKPNENVNFTEIISIETTYGVDKLEFTVQCNHENKKILLENIDEFYALCKSDKIKALICFKKEEFKEWLKENKYSTEIINYDKSILMGNNNFSIALKYFCMLNNVYINDIFAFNEVDNNAVNNIEHNSTSNITDVSIDKNITDNEDVENTEKETVSTKEKTFIQKLKQIFRRK